MTTSRPRDIVRSILQLLAVAVAVMLIYGHMHTANAAGDAAPPAGPAPTWNLGEVMALIALIISSVGAVVDAVRAVLHFTSPRTTSTLDDRAAAALDSLHNRISALEGALIRPAAAPAPKPALGVGVTTGIALIMALSIGAGTTACSSPAVKTAGRIAWDCTSSERKQAVDILTPLATNAVLNGVSPDGKHVDLSALKAATSKASLLTDLGVTLWCAASEAIAAIGNPPSVIPGAPQTAPLEVDHDSLRSAWQSIKPDAAFITRVTDADGNQVVM